MRILPCLAILLLAGAPPAQALSFFDVVNSTGSGTTSAHTDIVGPGLNFSVGQLRVNLDLNPGENAFITYTYLGREAAYRNQFLAADGSVQIDVRAPTGTSAIIPLMGSGLLDFGFRANMGPTVLNGSNAMGVFPQFGVVLNSDRLGGLLLLDDGGAGPDRDFDDMVVSFGVNVRPVPEASTWLLLSAGLLALGLTARAKRSPLR